MTTILVSAETVSAYISIAIVFFLVGIVAAKNYWKRKLENTKILYETVSTWNDGLTNQIKEYESKMDRSIFTFKYSDRALVGIGGEWYRCNYLGQSDDGKQFIKNTDFNFIIRSELPVPILEAQPLKK